MTIVPDSSASSIALRMAVTAAWSAPSRSPRPMSRAAAIAPASVARSASAMISLSMRVEVAIGLVLEVTPAGEDHRHVVTVGDLDRHLVPDAASGLDDGGHAGLGGDLDAVREREVGVAGHDRQRRSFAGLAQRNLDADDARRLAGAHADHGVLLGEHHGVGLDVADRAPGEEEVGQLLQGGAALRYGLELVAVLLQVVERLDEQASTDALEVEAADAELVAVCRGRRHLDDLEPALGAKDLQRFRRVAWSDDGLEEPGTDGARRRVVDHAVRADHAAIGRDAVTLERKAEGLGQVDDAGES